MEFRKALVWSMSGQFFSYLIVFSGSVVVARLLTPREMGIFAIAIATIGILNVLVAFDIGTYIVRAKVLNPLTVDSAFTLNGILAVLIAGGILLASFVASHFLDGKETARVLIPLAATPLIGALEFRPATMLRREMNFRAIALIGAGKAVVGTIVVVALATWGFSYMSLAYSNVGSALCGVLLTNLAARRHAALRLSLFESRTMIVFGLRMMSIGGIAAIANKISDVILGQILGLAALGLYARASSISNLIFDNVYGAMTRVVFVELSREFHVKGTLRDVFLRSFEIIIALLWPIQIGLAVLSGPAIYMLYGERWLGAALPLSFLMIAQCIVLCFGMNWELFVLRNETALQTRFEAIRALIGVVVFTLGSLFSVSGAAVGRIVEASFGFLLYRPHVNRMAGTEPKELARVFANSVGSTVAAILPSLLLMIEKDWSPRTPLLDISASILLGGLLWMLVLAWQRHPLVAEMTKMRNKFWGKYVRRSGRNATAL